MGHWNIEIRREAIITADTLETIRRQKMKLTRSFLTIFVLLLVLMIGTACNGSKNVNVDKKDGTSRQASESGTTDEWGKIVELAKKEGVVVYYGAPGSEEIINKAAKTFKEKYGIEVQYSGQRGNEMREKVLAESRSHRVLADIVSTGTTSMGTLKSENVLQKAGPNIPNMKFVPEALVDKDDTLTPIYVNTYGILINTNLVKPEDEPKSWDDLLDPKWKGKILADDPRAAGGANTWFTVTYAEFGREYHEKLAQQKPHFTREYLENEKAVARGDYPIYYPFIMIDGFSNLQGTPTKPIVPKEGLTFTPIVAGIVKNNPHPNAARLLMHWFLSEEGQRAFMQNGVPALRSDIDYGIPKDVAQYLAGSAKLMGSKSRKDIERTDSLTEASEIYGK